MMNENIEKAVSKLSVKKIQREDAILIIEEVKAYLPNNANEKRKLLKNIIDLVFLSIKDKKRSYSLGLMRFIFLSNLGDSLEELKAKGVFRSSNYDYQSGIIKELIYDICNFVDFNESVFEYFGSVLGLLALSPDMKNNKVKIVSAIKSRPNFLKTALALAESSFQDLSFNPNHEIKSRFDEVYTYSKEALISSISYAVSVYFEVRDKTKVSDLKCIDENVDIKYYKDIFLKCFEIQDFKEAEIKVDFFGHVLKKDEKNKLFYIENHDFEKAKSYGYTKTDLRMLSLSMSIAKDEEIASFYDAMESIWSEAIKDEGVNLYLLPKNPVERIVIQSLLFDYNDEYNFFSDGRLFKEEAAMLVVLENENYAKLLNKKIIGEITVLDVFKVQRYFYFIGFLYKKVCEKLKEERPDDAEVIRLRSVLPVFDEKSICSIISSVTGHDNEECIKLLNGLCAELPSDSGFTDLQYTPIVRVENAYIILPFVLATSNLVRSIALNNKIHLSVSPTHDSMVAGVVSALLSNGFKVDEEVSFGKCEADIVAFKDGELFLFECKNPYHPVNDFELRNTYSHLKKGLRQLKDMKESLADPYNLKTFCSKISLQLSSVNNIHYGVINANRALLGYERFGIRVFHANELINFLRSGTISSQEDTLRSWKDDSFHVKDLVSFINGDVVTKDFDTHLVDIFYVHNFRSNSLAFKEIGFDLESINKMVSSKYRKI
ncbi:hypothetical protein ABEG75_22425 [Pantoea agglomerans]|uniref:hypothetical protein n=1 Tax=Enterobacter agglomerans TaxID=549 RepID=UPI00165400FF|nr:hypothetical protein [Pantoea agglomerans]